MELMSSVAESAYVQALQHGASLNGLVLGEQLEDFSQNTESLVGKKLQDQQYISAIPQLQNPIVQLGVQAFMDKVREQNPTITPDEMKAQMNEYISELGKDLGLSSSLMHLKTTLPKASIGSQSWEWSRLLHNPDPLTSFRRI